MEKLTKLLVLVLAIVIGVGCVPMAFSEAKAAQVYAQEALPVLPEGEELGDEELLQAEGEFWWFLIGAVLVGGGRAVYENWFDEDYGIDKDDLKGIAATGLGAGIGGAAMGSIAAAAATFSP